MKINHIGRPEVRMISQAVIAAANAEAERLGVTLEGGGARFSATEATLKIVAKVKDTGSGQSADEALFRSRAGLFGLAPDDYGKAFVFNGSSYRIVSLDMKAHKYNVIGESVRGTRYKFMARDVKMALQNKGA